MRKITYLTSTFVALMALQVQTVNADNINKVSANPAHLPYRCSDFHLERPKETERLFRSEAVEKEIQNIIKKLTNKRFGMDV